MCKTSAVAVATRMPSVFRTLKICGNFHLKSPEISVCSCDTLKIQPWMRNDDKRQFLTHFFRKTGAKIKILIPTFSGQNLYLINPQVSFGSKENWRISSILKFLTIFQFFWPKNLKNGQKIPKFSLIVFVHFLTNRLIYFSTVSKLKDKMENFNVKKP